MSDVRIERAYATDCGERFAEARGSFLPSDKILPDRPRGRATWVMWIHDSLDGAGSSVGGAMGGVGGSTLWVVCVDGAVSGRCVGACEKKWAVVDNTKSRRGHAVGYLSTPLRHVRDASLVQTRAEEVGRGDGGPKRAGTSLVIS